MRGEGGEGGVRGEGGGGGKRTLHCAVWTQTWSENVMVALRSFSSLMRCTPPQFALRRIVLLVCTSYLPLMGDQTFLV